jgi:hypothetical protein
MYLRTFDQISREITNIYNKKWTNIYYMVYLI